MCITCLNLAMLSVKAIDKIEVKKMKKEKTIRLAIGGLLLTAVLVSGITVAQIDRKQSARTEENAHTETAQAVKKSTGSTEDEKNTQETAGNVAGQNTQQEQADVSVSAQPDEVEAVTGEVEATIPETEDGAEETKETSAPVQAAAEGTVSSIKVDEETGNTVTVDMGNGYEATYGQMTNLAVKEGDAVTRDTVLGYIEKTTKYYTREGDNLYFAVTKDGNPVDPVQYMETDGE